MEKIELAAKWEAVADTPDALNFSGGVDVFVIGGAGVMVKLLVNVFGKKIIKYDAVDGFEDFAGLVMAVGRYGTR